MANTTVPTFEFRIYLTITQLCLYSKLQLESI